MYEKPTTRDPQRTTGLDSTVQTKTSGKKDTKALKGMSFAEGEAALAPDKSDAGKRKKGGPLGVGSEGPEVMQLQRNLKKFSKQAEIDQAFKAQLNPGAVDGKFGAGVEQALKAFQSWQNLPMTGVLDPETEAAIAMELDFLRQSGG